MKRLILGALGALAVTAGAALAEYPEREIQGIIQWGAGGSTDTVMRAVTPHAEKVLGKPIVMQNMTGAVGAIALNYVAEQPADGYTLLMGAENPMLYKVMALGTRDYNDFTPIILLARGTPVIVARPDAPFDDYAQMVAHVKAHPGEVRFGSTGPGGLPSVINSMIDAVEGKLDVIKVPYDGDGPALTGLQGGAIDVMPAVLGVTIEAVRAGKMKVLTVMDTEPSPKLPDVAPVTRFNAAYETYLPWGPFFGIFVRKGTPAEAVEKLTAAYAEAVAQPDFKALMHDRGFTIMGISGAEAEAFLTKWQQGTAWLLHDVGMTKVSPEEFGIARPGR